MSAEADYQASSAIAAGATAPRTQKKYDNKTSQLEKYCLENFPHELDERGKIKVPLKEETIRCFLGSRSKTINGNDRSFSDLMGYKSAIVKEYRKRGLDFYTQCSEEMTIFLQDWASGAKRRKAQQKSMEGMTEDRDGREPFTVAGFRYLAKQAYLHATNFVHSFLMFCWVLIMRGQSVAEMQYAGLSWERDHLNVFIPTTKSDQAGTMAYKRAVYANPLQPDTCPILSLAVSILSSNYDGNQKYIFGSNFDAVTKKFGDWLGGTLKNIDEAEMIQYFGCSKDALGLHSSRKGAATVVATDPTGVPIISLFRRAGWSFGQVALNT